MTRQNVPIFWQLYRVGVFVLFGIQTTLGLLFSLPYDETCCDARTTDLPFPLYAKLTVRSPS